MTDSCYNGKLQGYREWYRRFDNASEFVNAIVGFYELCGVKLHEHITEHADELHGDGQLEYECNGVHGIIGEEEHAVVRDGKVLGVFVWSSRGGYMASALVDGKLYSTSSYDNENGKWREALVKNMSTSLYKIHEALQARIKK